jgi:uncharacterized protein involved in tellurium resistance
LASNQLKSPRAIFSFLYDASAQEQKEGLMAIKKPRDQESIENTMNNYPMRDRVL